MQTNSGIYAITNRNNGKRYIGSSADMPTRARIHLHHLRRGNHHSVKLQRSFNKHGEAAFLFRPLLVCAPRDLLMYEQRALDVLDAARSGYNVLPTAGSCVGVKRTEEQKRRIGAANRGNKYCLGHRHTAESRAKMSASQRLRSQQRVLSEEDRERLRQWAVTSNKARRGKQMSPEARSKMSTTHLKIVAEGRGHGFKPGHIISAETRAKMSAARRGLAHSPETRAKIAAANRARAAKMAGAL